MQDCKVLSPLKFELCSNLGMQKIQMSSFSHAPFSPPSTAGVNLLAHSAPCLFQQSDTMMYSTIYMGLQLFSSIPLGGFKFFASFLSDHTELVSIVKFNSTLSHTSTGTSLLLFLRLVFLRSVHMCPSYLLGFF